jgi:HSP20 family protein
MNVGRIDPFGDLSTVRDRLNRLFEEQQAVEPPGPGGRPVQSRVWRPLVDVFEDQDTVQVYLDLPGLDRSSIDVQLTGDSLTVRGERRQEKREGGHYVHVERPEGSFQRSFTLGIPVDFEKVQANYRDGVLQITLPKAETVKPRRVEVKAEG